MTVTFDIEREEASRLLALVAHSDLGNLPYQLAEAIVNADEARYDLLEEGKIL